MRLLRRKKRNPSTPPQADQTPELEATSRAEQPDAQHQEPPRRWGFFRRRRRPKAESEAEQPPELEATSQAEQPEPVAHVEEPAEAAELAPEAEVSAQAEQPEAQPEERPKRRGFFRRRRQPEPESEQSPELEATSQAEQPEPVAHVEEPAEAAELAPEAEVSAQAEQPEAQPEERPKRRGFFRRRRQPEPESEQSPELEATSQAEQPEPVVDVEEPAEAAELAPVAEVSAQAEQPEAQPEERPKRRGFFRRLRQPKPESESEQLEQATLDEPDAGESKSPFLKVARQLPIVRYLVSARASDPAPVAPVETPDEEALPQQALSARTRLDRAVRNLREEFELRRRPRTMAISLEDGVARAVVLEGQEIVAWGKADPAEEEDDRDDSDVREVESVALQQVEDVGADMELSEEETSLVQAGAEDSSDRRPDPADIARIRSLLTELRARGTRLVTELPLYAPLIRHIPLPDVRRRYVEPVLMSEVAERIPFELDEVDVKWRLERSDGGNTAMAIAVQKSIVDDHVRVMEEAGGRPLATYSQAAAFALAAGVPDAIIVHVTRGRSAVVLVRGGVPQAVYEVVRPVGEERPEDQADALARAVEQMDSYDQTLGAEGEVRQLPLVLTGEGASGIDLRQTLHREVISLSPQVTVPDGFPVAEYASTVGLAILDAQRPKILRRSSDKGAASLNLLSDRHLPKPLPVVPIGVFLGLALFAGVLVFTLSPKVAAADQDAAAAMLQVESKEGEERRGRLKLGSINNLRGQARDVRQQTIELKSYIDGLSEEMAEQGARFELIETITEFKRPDTVSVANLAPEGDRFRISGVAPTLGEAVQYTDNLRDSGLFVEVNITSVSGAGRSQPGGSPGPGGAGESGPRLVSFVITATAIGVSSEDADEDDGE